MRTASFAIAALLSALPPSWAQPTPTPVPEHVWHDISKRFEQIDECPVRVVYPLAEVYATPQRRYQGATANAISVRCDGATLSNLEIRRAARSVDLTLQPWVSLRAGRDKLALLRFEVWQEDRRLAVVEGAVPLDEGGTNWENPLQLKLTRQVRADGPPPVLRIEMVVEEE